MSRAHVETSLCGVGRDGTEHAMVYIGMPDRMDQAPARRTHRSVVVLYDVEVGATGGRCACARSVSGVCGPPPVRPY